MKHLQQILGIGLILLLAACGGGGGGGGGTKPVINSFTATPSSLPTGGGSTTLAWNVTGATTLSIDQGIGAVTPVTSGSTSKSITATTTFTLTATNASGSVTQPVTVTVAAAPATITVAGKVLKYNGDPIDGVNVQVTDVGGAKPLVLTNATGDFSVSGVQTPYTLSVVPNTATGLLPVTYDNVTRPDPKVVVTTLTAPPTFCSLANSTLNITLSAAVGAGNTGRAYFVGDGVSVAPLISYRSSLSMAPGVTNTTISVTHDNTLCVPTISGKTLYIERDAGGTVVKVAISDTTMTTGNTTNKTLTVVPATSRTISGSVNFPTGIASAQVIGSIKIGNSYVQLVGATATVTPGSPSYLLAVVDLPGIQYRVTAIGGAFPQQDWAHTDTLDVSTGNVTGANLSLASLGATVAPAGAIKSTTPAFSYTPVSGMNFYYSYMTGSGSNWLGATGNTSITLPSGLPAPARNSVGSSYNWYALNAINVRNPGSNVADAVLDGRLIKHNFFYQYALYEPDVIASGSLNFTPTAYNIIP